MGSRLSAAILVAAAAGSAGCESPFLAKDGTLVFPERGAHGASVLTANGVEFRDRADIPQRVVFRDPSEPWRAPVGFILPKDGRFTETSRPTLVATTGLGVVIRPSDKRVPSWGGEVLMRIDLIAPAAEGTARFGENVAIVVDGTGDDARDLAAAALDQLASRDRVTILDARGPKVIVPTVPATNRSLALAALEKRLGERNIATKVDWAAALRLASDVTLSAKAKRRVLVLSEGRDESLYGEPVNEALKALTKSGVVVGAVGTSNKSDFGTISAIASWGGGPYSAEPSLDARTRVVRQAVPESGIVAFRDVSLTFEGTPAPSHVLEASGGDVRWKLDAGVLHLGDVHAGEARTEVLRVTVPPWVPGERFEFTVRAHVNDVRLGDRREFSASIPCTYDDDIERIAQSRHGDVIAYASAMATLRRLDAAFVGEGLSRAGGLRNVARLHANSMAMLGAQTHDRALIEQAEMLSALLYASE
jgi:hypothetical protein